MASTLAANALCSIANMHEYFSEHGINAFADHENQPAMTPTNGVVERAINRASAFIYGRLERRYTAAEIQASEQAQHYCVVIACVSVTRTQGNGVPDSIATDFDYTMKEIAHIWDCYTSLTTA